ncbi:MAG TPA: hypothetical protein PK402_10130 [Tepidisphaeraceae bacterium]|nr:hypothetical protein [Tepidisphaeraceae bacterium]
MRTSVVIILLGLLGAGCASKQSHEVTSTPTTQNIAIRQPSAAALVFDPPSRHQFDVYLDRHDPAVAYMGYETVFIETSWVRQDDRFRGDDSNNQDRFERRAVSTRIIERSR